MKVLASSMRASRTAERLQPSSLVEGGREEKLNLNILGPLPGGTADSGFSGHLVVTVLCSSIEAN